MGEGGKAPPEALRVDKWLCHVRFFKTRERAAAMVLAGGLRINRQPSRKPDARVRVGDHLTFPQSLPESGLRPERMPSNRGGPNIRMVAVLALPPRRLSPDAASACYRDLANEAQG